MNSFSITGRLIDVHKEKIYPATITVANGKIISINEVTPDLPASPSLKLQRSKVGRQGSLLTTHYYILPGFIDSHVHIESSMLVPSEFAKLAVVHGTIATVSDPHEIANVCGIKGVEFMIENGKTVPFKFNFGAPSCVPATAFETAGATLNAEDVEKLLLRDDIKYLSEMMNFPGVLHKDEEVMKKIAAAHRLHKPVDGHAPGLRGKDAKRYIQALLNPPQGGTLESESSNTHYNYHTAEPSVYGLLKKFVKEHRETPTHAENVLWHLLRGRKLDGYKFRRQHIIGSYIADFVCLNKRLIIEVDGLIHQIPENKTSDAERTFELNKLGFNVIRFTNEEIFHTPDKVLAAILHEFNKITTVKSESENPPLEGREAFPLVGERVIISTDHECFTKEEALDKLQYGMKILIREGSAAKNFEALIDLLNDYPDHIMFCSDDKHPDSLVEGHINQLCARAVAKGIDIFKIIKAACINPVLHYKLDVGLLREGDDADFIVVKDLKKFEVSQTYINGELVAENGKSTLRQVQGRSQQSAIINNFSCTRKTATDFAIPLRTHDLPAGRQGSQLTTIIQALDGQLITNKLTVTLPTDNDQLTPDIQNDILKIVVVNRYKDASVAKGFVKNFGLKQGAIASSVAHDSHNVIAVGVDDECICKAVNKIIEHKGGVSCCCPPSFGGSWREVIIPLPVAGLMSNEDGYKVAKQYSLIDKAAKEAGCTLTSPFMTLSFMALLVIPHIKLSDLGLFDGDKFELIK